MIPDFNDEMSLRDAYGPAMEITDPEEAKAYFEALVQWCLKTMADEGKRPDRAEAEEIMRSNLGYYAGHGDVETRKRVQELFGANHPVFGAVASDDE